MSWKRQQAKLLKNTGQSYESWFLDDDGKIDYQRMIETLDELIRSGAINFA
ncbi:hypothetical protein [Moorena producens]|uniref:hypothetical protein n=1 Tax=Moorena producens TaxID=1155739 RepID=UPI003C72A1DB